MKTKQPELVDRLLEAHNNLVASHKELFQKVFQLEELIKHNERKYIEQNIGEYDLFDFGKPVIKLEQGVEYINKISTIEIIKQFYWNQIEQNMINYAVEFENVEGKYSIVRQVNQGELLVGMWLKHYLVGVEIKTYRVISD
jgi:hypothetical protein